MADLPGMAGRALDPAALPGYVAPSNPLTSMLAPILSPLTAATSMSREDDMRPLVQPAPPRPPVAIMPPASAPVRAPRPSQVVSAPLPPASLALASRAPAPPSRVASPPQPRVPPAAQPQHGHMPPPQRVATAPVPSSGVPRPPGAIGSQEAHLQPVSNNSSSGGFFDNLFGRR
jgi:hypothetical protein